MTTELPDSYNSEHATGPLALKSNEGLGPLVEPVTLADVLDALNVFNRPHPSEGNEPWTENDFISVKHLPDFINIIACAWFSPAPMVAAERERCAAIARRWGETHADGVTVNARNAASKIARGIEGPNVADKRPVLGSA